VQKSLAAAEQALRLNPNLPEVHIALGSIYNATGKSTEAVSELQNALHVHLPPGAPLDQVFAVHPTEIYETITMLVVFWWLWRQRDHPLGSGWLTGWYLVLGGLERFLVEFLRAKDDRLLGPFTLAQATSAGLVLVGAYLLNRWRGATASDAEVVKALAPRPVVRSAGG